MKIIFVGTSSGKTSLNQFHSSLLMSGQNYNLLIDAGDGISRALLSRNIGFNSIDGIIFTHLHPDHFDGFPGLIVQMKFIKREKPLDIFIHKSLKYGIEESLLRSYLFPERIKFELNYLTFADDEQKLVADDFSFIARKNSHLDKLQKYSGDHKSISLYSASLSFEVEGKQIIYTSDIGSEEDILLFRDKSSNVFICEANHIEPAKIIEVLGKVEASKIFLIHYSDDDFTKLSEILSTLDTLARNRILFAKDGLSFEI